MGGRRRYVSCSNGPARALSTNGASDSALGLRPAEIRTEVLPCESVGLAHYVLVPRTSDLLFNLENSALVVATADTWQVRWGARLLTPHEYPDGLAIARMPEASWSEMVEVCPPAAPGTR